MKKEEDLDTGFMISSFINIFLVLIIAFGSSSLSMPLLIILVIITMLNAGYLVYKAMNIRKKHNN
ncbi:MULTISPECIES: hypothetical protein [Staphylococcus]|uniref:Uncharacterized protein n=1 Tax=Staphylococcus equorum TaxID=246432 RepID=A0A1E5TJX2_9STAP|nr:MULTISPECIES: hypothetical protein [Staphylococcus]ANK38401.1 hypothetical protein AOB58_1599 [Staphylococcus sp. AntiMn-1]ANR67167.1 hypothetical protein AWC34_00840 [Staphylococcus equorum]ERH34609.1 hypothetical protein SEQU_09815 [Staphylococcus equorum UMC-CNS-924]KKI53681.1 hypothetical protein UF72_1503 [Staphylococcus equorum subsp. equorum]MCE5008011.1 hypothetical protein [Staphylococcus equorum]